MIHVGDTVSWTTNSRGVKRERKGTVLEVIPPLKHPVDYIDEYSDKYNTKSIDKLVATKVETAPTYFVAIKDTIHWVKETQIEKVERSPFARKIILVYEEDRYIKDSKLSILVNIFICFRLRRIFKVLSEKGYCVISANSNLLFTGVVSDEHLVPLMKEADACLFINVYSNIFAEYNLSLKKPVFNSFSELVESTWYKENTWAYITNEEDNS